MTRRTLLRMTVRLGVVAALAVTWQWPAVSQEKIKIRAASLTLPVADPMIVNLIKERGIDARNGFDMEVKAYPSIAAFYAAFATGEIDTEIGGPIIFQRMRNEGVPLRIIATGLRQFPAVSGRCDLRPVEGADARHLTVVQASFPLARTQLAAGRVDASMMIEPIATMMLKENPRYRILFNGGAAWREMTGAESWELVAAMREDFIRCSPAAVERWIAALQDVAGQLA